MVTNQQQELPKNPKPDLPKPRRINRRPFVILGVVAALTGGGYVTYRLLTRGKVSTDDAQIEADVIPIGTRVGGTIARVAVSDNEHVSKGKVILELDPADYQVRFNQAKAELDAADAQARAADAQVTIAGATSHGGLASAQAQLSGSAVSVRSADAQVTAARAALEKAKSDLSKVSADYDRAKRLADQHAIAGVELEHALAAYDSARAAVDQAQAQVAGAEEQRAAAQSRVAEARGHLDQSAPVDAQVQVAQANADLAHARVDAAKAALEQARLQLSYTQIQAPEDGVVSRLAVHAGQTVQPGQTVVAIVPEVTYVLANFKETQISHMKPGQLADVEIDAIPNHTFEARVVSLSAATGARFSLLPPDNATGNYVKVVQRVPVRLEWVKPPSRALLQAGLSANVTVHVN